jgi:hypothetical protein
MSRYLAVAPYAVGALFFGALAVGVAFLFARDNWQNVPGAVIGGTLTFGAAALYLAQETWRRLRVGAPADARAFMVLIGVPFAILAVAVSFGGLLALSMGMFSPARETCVDAKDVVLSSISALDRWEFRAPAAGSGQGIFETEKFTVGEQWSITWSREQGQLDITLYDTPSYGFAEIAHDDGDEDQLAPSTTTRNLTRPGTYCLKIQAFFMSGTPRDTTRIQEMSRRTDWKITIEDHR